MEGFKATGDLVADILRLLEWRGDGLSFLEIQKFLPETIGHYSLLFGNENLWLWDGVSDSLIDALASPRLANAIDFQPCGALSYLADGGGLNLPIAKSIREYKKPHWFPVLICKKKVKIAA